MPNGLDEGDKELPAETNGNHHKKVILGVKQEKQTNTALKRQNVSVPSNTKQWNCRYVWLISVDG